MSDPNEELLTMVRRNILLGMWAAEKLGLVGESSEAYAKDLAMGALDFKRSDVLSKIRVDFKAAGMVHSDEEILRVSNEFWLQASGQEQSKPGDSTDAALVQIARNLMPK